MYRETALEGNELPYVVNTANYSLIILLSLDTSCIMVSPFPGRQNETGPLGVLSEITMVLFRTHKSSPT